jgi:hypothetical protein
MASLTCIHAMVTRMREATLWKLHAIAKGENLFCTRPNRVNHTGQKDAVKALNRLADIIE